MLTVNGIALQWTFAYTRVLISFEKRRIREFIKIQREKDNKKNQTLNCPEIVLKFIHNLLPTDENSG